MNLDELFRASVDRDPSRPAFVGGGVPEALTYAELDHLIERCATELRHAGMIAGDVVGLHCDSGIDYVVLVYAVWRCGAAVVPIAVELTAAERADIPQRMSLRWLITGDAEPSCVREQWDGSRTELRGGRTLFGLDPAHPAPDGLAAINSAFIRFTSGTTGDSKGVVLSHETIRDRIHAANDALELGPTDRVVWLLSMSYHFAVSIVGYLSFGCTIVLPENLFGPAILKAIADHEATFVYGSPLHYGWMVDVPGDVARPASLRLAISTTSPLEAERGRAFEERFGLPLTQSLGIIEVGLPCINVGFASSRPEAVGPVLPAYELRLREPEVPIEPEHGGECGEILFRGPGFVDAYYHPWRTRDELFTDGWFATGDVGELDADGCLWIRGRSKNVINIAGMKFFPEETVAVLERHPAIRAARVYAVQHPRWGELARAELILATDAEPPTNGQLTGWCREHLAPYKIPVEFAFVTNFPRTASGKVLHRATEPNATT